ncbi:MAG: hypothetical protein E6713_00295 [Sporomusaceae bacterium]|nr:hypothetical protein [Sporomusaceae bacterium]
MTEYLVKRRFESPLTTGVVLTVICFIVALIYWPIWGLIVKSIAISLAGPGLAAVDAKVAAKYIGVLGEGTFFWMAINAWIWQTLLFGNYGKYHVTELQPKAGIRYSLIGLLTGIVGFFILIGFIGIWWKPFSLGILFMPKTAAEVQLAIEGWEVGNFYCLAVIITQISYVALFQKWPFAGKAAAPIDSVGAMAISTVLALIVWFAMFFPSLMSGLSLGGHGIVDKPFGSWAAFLAFCQAFIFFFLIPAEGGERYPQKLFAKTQPYAGLVGLAIALAAALIVPPILRAIVEPLNLVPGVPADLVVASLELSTICFQLTWHHLFDDYPSAEIVSNDLNRALIRFGIWLGGGMIFGLLWLQTFKLLSYGGNDLGLGYPVMGLLAGQFALLMVILYCNTFFDKWPLVYKVPVKVSNKKV